MRAFIVRPFGKKRTLSNKEIDFDQVEVVLIRPALARAEIAGGTTAEFLQAGNIRADMFEQLLKADLVVADLSIHNANVFYELGIRHALRDKRTVLIRCSGDEIPFDLTTDRYLTYNADDPAASVDTLAQALRATRDGTAVDSPVFLMLPSLKPQDWTQYLIVPEDFTEEVERAGTDGHVGDLEMLAAETAGFDWQVEGLRKVGRKLFSLKAWESARDAWAKVAALKEGDGEADALLPTIYQRLGDLARSAVALERALKAPNLPPERCAELHALRGSNEKELWTRDWGSAASDKQREAALESGHLIPAFEAYMRGVEEDPGHFYSGLNALAMVAIAAELAAALPAVWRGIFDDDAQADARLSEFRRSRADLETVVRFSIVAAQKRTQRSDRRDIWADASLADLRVLTSSRPTSVAKAYGDALADATSFNFDAVRRQLHVFQSLGLFTDNVAAALTKLDELEMRPGAAAKPDQTYLRVLLFTGHMIDQPGRTPARFPKEKEEVARQAIHDAVVGEIEQARAAALRQGTPVDIPVLAIAGAACGGDLLFHEVCETLNPDHHIETHVHLALPRDQFIVSSVQHAGPAWVERFNTVCDRVTPRVLADSEDLPRWLRKKKGYTIWSRNNLWTLYSALAYGGRKVTLIALWDGGTGDGPGGTEDMVQQAQARGAKTIHLNTKDLFHL